MRIAALNGWTSEQRNVVIASFLGWTLDAFDFFLMLFVPQGLIISAGTVKKSEIALMAAARHS
jgi:hypothetical protein